EEEMAESIILFDFAIGCRLRSRTRSEEHTSELQSLTNIVCRLLLEKKKDQTDGIHPGDLSNAALIHVFLYNARYPAAMLVRELVSLPGRRIKFHFILFFFNDTAPTEIYSLSLHDALPI